VTEPTKGQVERANTAQMHVGRLLEIAADAGYRTPADVDRLFASLDAQVASLVARGGSYVTVADLRYCPLMSPMAAEQLKTQMASRNSRVLRSAGLVSHESPAAVLQFARVTREAGLKDRKVFEDPVELLRWLEDILTGDEASRLCTFLGIDPALRRRS